MSSSHRTVAGLAAELGGKVRGDGGVAIHGINAIAEAGAGEITFISRPRYARLWMDSAASAAVVSERAVAALPIDDTRPVIVVADAEIASIRLLEIFEPPVWLPAAGVDASASLHPTARIGEGVRIGPQVSIGENARIGDRVVLHAGVRVYAGVEIGVDSVLHANVVVRERCRIGRRVVLHQNTSIGADGFGYRPDPNGGGMLKVPHIGNVVVEDDVEIGANSCVDRGKFGSTVIGAGTKIDNLCQIAHNVCIGRCCTISAQTGLSGSVVVGNGVQIGGRGGASDHVSIGDRARLGGNSVAFKDVPAGSTWIGFPADEAGAVKRQWASLRRLPQLIAKLHGGRERPGSGDSSPDPS